MVAVLGGSGFLGSYVVDELRERGADVLIVDIVAPYPISHPFSQPKTFFHHHDLRAPTQALVESLRGANVVLNLAAVTSGVGYSSRHHGHMLTENALVCLNALEAARVAGIKDYLLVSSACVYPDRAAVPTREDEPWTASPESANAGYGWAKRLAEKQAEYYAIEHGMRIAIARPFNAYGARYRWPGYELAHLVPSLVKRVCDGEDPIKVWGNGDQRRNLLHARDVASAIVALLPAAIRDGGAAAEPINVGTKDSVSPLEILEVLAEITGRRFEVSRLEDRPVGADVKRASSLRLMDLLPDWRPEVSLHDGLREMIEEWYPSYVGSINR